MAKRKHHRRRAHHRRRSNPHRRRRRSMFMLNPRRHHVRRRRRNPDGFTRRGIVPMVVGGGVGFLAARLGPQNLLKQYNTGITGYALNAGFGIGASWLLGRFWNRDAAMGGYIGTGVAVLSRIIVEQFNIGGGGGISGDLDFDLGYYVSERFPFPQGAGGPYDTFIGTPYLPGGAPVTSASAVRAGAAAAALMTAVAASAPAAAAPAAGGMSGRWDSRRWG